MLKRPARPKRPSKPSAGSSSASKAPTQSNSSRRTVSFGAPQTDVGHKTILYGPGGIGKTTLAAMLSQYLDGIIAFADLDESLPILADQLSEFPVQVIQGIESFEDLREALQSDGFDEVRAIVIDSGTKAEELVMDWVVSHIPHEKGNQIERIEDYGYGKGYAHIYETYLRLLSDLDRHVRAGRHVVMICHDIVAEVPNPIGENWIRFEPRLQPASGGKNSIRLKVREWADHVLFVGYDVDVQKGRDDKVGKGKGKGTRTIYPVELPHCMAKSRTLAESMPFELESCDLWTQLLCL